MSLAGLDRMQAELEAISRRSVPFAARETVNGLAFAGRQLWQDEMRRSLTLRNRYTERQARVVKARSLNMANMEAVLGHPEPYMAWLERGGREKASKRFRAIPTETAAGQAEGSLAGGRKRAVRPPLIITRLGKLPPLKSARGRKTANAMAIKAAIKSGRRLALLRLDRGRVGVYRVSGKKKLRVQKLYDVSRRSTPVPKTPTLAPAMIKALNRGPALAFAALEKQLARAKAKAA